MISVIIPAHNAEATIADCLRCLQSQTRGAPDELLVVDDDSSDQTAARAEALGARVIRLPRVGPAAARNAGMAAARGDFILFTDADCSPAPDWIAQLLTPLHSSATAGVKGAYATRQRQWVPRMVQLEFEERYDRLQAAPHIDFFDTHSLALRKSAQQTLGAFDTALANNEDVDMAYRFVAGGFHIAFNRRAVVYHRHPADWLTYIRVKFWRGYGRMQVYRRYPGRMIEDSYTPNNLKLQIVLLGAAAVAAALSLSGLFSSWVAAFLIVACLLAGWPLYRVAWRHDRALLPLLPLFVFARALAIGLGAAFGILTLIGVMPLLSERGRGRT
ncbi:MAG: glycosyltransferase [Chloroflexi bacterium]|nr:glycosyltransferase [Chloroflexota bacterium]